MATSKIPLYQTPVSEAVGKKKTHFFTRLIFFVKWILLGTAAVFQPVVVLHDLNEMAAFALLFLFLCVYLFSGHRFLSNKYNSFDHHVTRIIKNYLFWNRFCVLNTIYMLVSSVVVPIIGKSSDGLFPTDPLILIPSAILLAISGITAHATGKKMITYPTYYAYKHHPENEGIKK